MSDNDDRKFRIQHVLKSISKYETMDDTIFMASVDVKDISDVMWAILDMLHPDFETSKELQTNKLLEFQNRLKSIKHKMNKNHEQ